MAMAAHGTKKPHCPFSQLATNAEAPRKTNDGRFSKTCAEITRSVCVRTFPSSPQNTLTSNAWQTHALSSYAPPIRAASGGFLSKSFLFYFFGSDSGLGLVVLGKGSLAMRMSLLARLRSDAPVRACVGSEA